MKKVVIPIMLFVCCLLILTGCDYQDRITCSNCKKSFYEDEMCYRGDTDEYICSSCAFNLELSKCYDCGYYYDYENCSEVDGYHLLCLSCIRNNDKIRCCDNCGKPAYEYTDLYETRTIDYVCWDCIWNGYYSRCPICDAVDDSDNFYYSEYYDEYVCEDCIEEYD